MNAAGAPPCSAAGEVLRTAVVGVLAIIPLFHDGNGTTTAWVFTAALVLPLLARCRAPVAVLGLLCIVSSVQLTVGVRVPADFALLVALFTVASRRPRVQAYAAAAAVEGLGIVAAFRIGPSRDGHLASVLFTSGLVAAAFFAGTSLQARRSYLASVLDRAERLEREQAQLAQLAVTEERNRIAREMHDIVAHSLAVMITLAEAARAAGGEADTPADRAMSQVASTGRDAMAEMRQLLGVLRRDDTPALLAPQPGLGQLEELVETARSTGLPVRLSTTGPSVATGSALGTTVYRLVQEALTNVLKHADGPTCVSVVLTWTSEALDVAVEDDGRPHLGPQPGRTGLGLLGMTDRVAVFGGDMRAGPAAAGWRVHARLPLTARATA